MEPRDAARQVLANNFVHGTEWAEYLSLIIAELTRWNGQKSAPSKNNGWGGNGFHGNEAMH